MLKGTLRVYAELLSVYCGFSCTPINLTSMQILVLVSPDVHTLQQLIRQQRMGQRVETLFVTSVAALFVTTLHTSHDFA